MESKELTSNEYYSLSELFSAPNRKIIIPDFQRDYCWGDKTHGEKNDTDIVSGFLDTLFEEFTNNTGDVLLGKIDAYEFPKNHIYLTDGQQRLTTLYLIIGILYRNVQDREIKDKLKGCLISDSEEKLDNLEPYLQYAVRESTVFFLRDLVNEFFFGDFAIEKYRIEYQERQSKKELYEEETLLSFSIKKQPWYFNEYDLDPSIISMLRALGVIEEKLNEIDIVSFSEFVIKNIKIQYYDVKDKKHGEERFVIINTTGKSLTLSENIKPILLGKVDNPMLAKQWEERESWFWKNRKKEESIADKGVEDFLIWCLQIIDKQEEVNTIKKAKLLLKAGDSELYLNKIQTHFEALKLLIEYLKEDEFQNQFMFINDNREVKSIVDIRNLSKEKQQIILLPLLSFLSKFDNKKDECYLFLRRLRKNYFDQKWKDRNGNYVHWCYVLQIIEKSESIDEILKFDNKNFEQIGKITLPDSVWYNDEEKQKHSLSEHKQLLDKWEDYSDFMGDLSPLFKMVENSYDIINLEKYYDIYLSIQIDNFNFSDEIYIKNIYRLYHYIWYGKFEHRSVSGYGYCMLVKSDVKLFLLDGFNEVWQHFYQDNGLREFFNEKIKAFIKDKIIKDRDLNDLLDDIRLIGHYERVQLWSILEFLYSENELNFKDNICQFWEYPNLIKIEEDTEKNNYSIGNLLLGTSYYNNKSGWIDFTKYPKMKLIYKNRENYSVEHINLSTIDIKNRLCDFLYKL
jgi:hypothetical protein